MFFTTPDAVSLSQDLKNFVRIHAEPVPATGVYAQYKVMELARGNVVVTLDGQGADEMLAGYHYFFGFFFKDLLRRFRLGRLSWEMFYYLVNHRSIYGFKSFGYLLMPESIRRRIMVDTHGYLSDSYTREYRERRSEAENLYDPDNMPDALFSHFEYKLEHLLKWEDRNSMFFSLEARVPFLDHNLVERCLASEGLDRINNGMTKAVLREGMKGLVPEKIRLRKDKLGFGTPQDEWLREPFFRDLVRDVLGRESRIGNRYVNTEKAAAVYEEHLSGRANNSKEIWKMINLELWMREFFV